MKKRLVVLTGAGISAESGLRTFRGNDGMWEHENIEDVCTPDALRRDPKGSRTSTTSCGRACRTTSQTPPIWR